jgi:hypothetical protein
MVRMQEVTQVGVITTGTADDGRKTWSGWLSRSCDRMTQHAPFFGDLAAALGVSAARASGAPIVPARRSNPTNGFNRIMRLKISGIF